MNRLKQDVFLRIQKRRTSVQVLLMLLVFGGGFYFYHHSLWEGLSTWGSVVLSVLWLGLLVWDGWCPASLRSSEAQNLSEKAERIAQQEGQKKNTSLVSFFLLTLSWAVLPLALGLRWGLWPQFLGMAVGWETFKAFVPVLLVLALSVLLFRRHGLFRLGVLGLWTRSVNAKDPMGRAGRTVEGILMSLHVCALAAVPWFLSAFCAIGIAHLIGWSTHVSVLVLVVCVLLNLWMGGVRHRERLKKWARQGMGLGGFWWIQTMVLVCCGLLLFAAQHYAILKGSSDVQKLLSVPFHLHVLSVFTAEDAWKALLWGGWALSSLWIASAGVLWRGSHRVFKGEVAVLSLLACVGPLCQWVLLRFATPPVLELLGVLAAVYLLFCQWGIHSTEFVRYGLCGEKIVKKKRKLVKDVLTLQTSFVWITWLWLMDGGRLLALIWGTCAMINVMLVCWITISWFFKQDRLRQLVLIPAQRGGTV